MSSLHFAAKNGSLEAVKYLVSMGLNVSAADRWLTTPLTYAIPFSQVYQYLVTVGAVEGPASSKFIVLNSAYNSTKPTDNDFLSIYASYYGDTQSLKILQAQGRLNLHATDRNGRSPLVVAASEGQLESFKYLISNGASLLIKDYRG